MNIRTADRLRAVFFVVQFLLTASAIWIAVLAGLKAQRTETNLRKETEINGKQTYAIYLIGGVLDQMLGLNNSTPPPKRFQLPPLEDLEGPQHQLFKLKHPVEARPMFKVSTKESVRRYRNNGRLPPILTSRFLEMLTKTELEALYQKLKPPREEPRAPKYERGESPKAQTRAPVEN